MLEWMETARDRLDADVFVQRGATPDRSGLATVEYLAPDDLAALLRSADVVVCHGGPGTISACVASGHRPIVVPRDPSRGEHVDDHQLRYARKLAGEGVVDIAENLEELVHLLQRPRRSHGTVATASVADAVTEFSALVERLISGSLPRRTLRQRLQFRRTP